MSSIPFTDIVNTAVGLADLGISSHYRRKNYELQKKAYTDYRSDVDITRAREDTAVQRRAADMRAAGINPILAAGAPAAASQPAQGDAPRHDAPQRLLDVIAAKEQISSTRAERERVQTETDYIKSQKIFQDLQNEYFTRVGDARANIEERENRIQEALEPTTIRRAQQEFTNLYNQGQGYVLDNEIKEQQKRLNELAEEMEKIGIRRERIQERVDEIQKFVKEQTWDNEIQDSLSRRQALQIANQQAELLLEQNQYNLNLSKTSGRRTTDSLRGEQWQDANIIWENMRRYNTKHQWVAPPENKTTNSNSDLSRMHGIGRR